jgi:hypothetical protein
MTSPKKYPGGGYWLKNPRRDDNSLMIGLSRTDTTKIYPGEPQTTG